MIGGNKLFTFFRATESPDSINAVKKTYSEESPLYENKWCRKVRRNPNDRVSVKTNDSSRPLVEDFLLIVPIEVEIAEDDIAREVDTGYDYLVLGAEDVSRMGQTLQCPIVRIKGMTKVVA